MLRIGTGMDEITPALNTFALCAAHKDPIGNGVTQTFLCQSYGRFLIIQKEGPEVLTLCEVKVLQGILVFGLTS